MRTTDHPRSRGVYRGHMSRTSIPRGSSPLARGLLRASVEKGLLERIIPARAGFTRRRSRCGSAGGDHPRSRGVYDIEDLLAMTEYGSSPLARGLRNRTMFIEYEQRIIPARAGFTSCGATAWAARSDHPRSRGVYAWTACGAGRGGGSSPLARGLLQLDADRAPPQRIIPARAGFTPGLV